MKIYLLTLNWNGKEKIQKLKDSLLPCLEGKDFKWLIKDNGSADGSIDTIKSWEHPSIEGIAYEHNKDNYAQGMNILFEMTQANDNDVIITLNNDVIFQDIYSIKNMIDILQKPNVGLVGAKLNFADTTIQHAGVLFHPKTGMPFHYRSKESETDYDRQNREFPAVTGALTALTAGTYRQLYQNPSGRVGFNESYFWAFEDIDMCMRVRILLKKKIVMCGKVRAYHEESGSLKKNPVNKMFMPQNVRLFLEWAKHIDIKENNKFADMKYNLFKG